MPRRNTLLNQGFGALLQALMRIPERNAQAEEADKQRGFREKMFGMKQEADQQAQSQRQMHQTQRDTDDNAARQQAAALKHESGVQEQQARRMGWNPAEQTAFAGPGPYLNPALRPKVEMLGQSIEKRRNADPGLPERQSPIPGMQQPLASRMEQAAITQQGAPPILPSTPAADEGDRDSRRIKDLEAWKTKFSIKANHSADVKDWAAAEKWQRKADEVDREILQMRTGASIRLEDQGGPGALRETLTKPELAPRVGGQRKKTKPILSPKGGRGGKRAKAIRIAGDYDSSTGTEAEYEAELKRIMGTL